MKLSRKCEENCEGKKGKENSMESNEQTYAKDPFFLSLIQIIQIKHSSDEVQKELLKIKNEHEEKKLNAKTQVKNLINKSKTVMEQISILEEELDWPTLLKQVLIMKKNRNNKSRCVVPRCAALDETHLSVARGLI